MSIEFLKKIETKIKLIKLYEQAKYCQSSLEIEKIYLQALKELIKLGTNNLIFQTDLKKYYLGNCYTYALGLPSLTYLIKKYCELEISDVFPFNLGFMNQKSYYLNGNGINTVLNAFKSDCDSLNIKVYETNVKADDIHGGYKIALFYYCNKNNQDFHFIRQNQNGTWSDKQGYFLPPRLLPSFNEYYKGYDFLGTFEIVKPVIRQK